MSTSTITSTTTNGPGLLRVHAWIIVFVTTLTMGATLFALSSGETEYTATAEVEVLPKASDSGPAMPPDMGTERELASSSRVADIAADDLGLDESADVRAPLEVSVVTDTYVLVISYTSANREEALRGADVFARAYIDYRNLSQSARAARMVTDPEITEGGLGLGSPQVAIALSLMVGLCLGVATAFAWDRASGRVRTPAELEETGLPVLGVLGPRERQRPGIDRVGVHKGLGHLAVRVAALTDGRPGAMIVVTGTEASPHSSSVAAELARALSALGTRAVLIDPEMASLGASAAGPVVVVDTPALLEEPRGALLADAADVVLAVTKLGRSRRRDVHETAVVLQPVPGAAPRPHRLAGWVVCTSGFRVERRGSEPTRTDGRHRDLGSARVAEDLSAWEGRPARG